MVEGLVILLITIFALCIILVGIAAIREVLRHTRTMQSRRNK